MEIDLELMVYISPNLIPRLLTGVESDLGMRLEISVSDSSGSLKWKSVLLILWYTTLTTGCVGEEGRLSPPIQPGQEAIASGQFVPS